MGLVLLPGPRVILYHRLISAIFSLIDRSVECYRHRIRERLHCREQSTQLALNLDELRPKPTVLLLQGFHPLAVGPLVDIDAVAQLSDAFCLSAAERPLR